MEVIFCNKPPNCEQWRKMREIGGWSICDDDTFQYAISNTNHFVCVYHNKEIIGMGRVVGDNCLCFHIHDVVVAENYRKKGIGKLIIMNLLTYIKSYAHPKATITLMAHVGSENLYRVCGFISRPNSTKGPGMYISNENYSFDLAYLENETYKIELN